LAQIALADYQSFPDDCGVAWGPLEIALVSYMEWVKLIGTSLLISSALTAAMFAPWVLSE
jgi:hypothetical protein